MHLILQAFKQTFIVAGKNSLLLLYLDDVRLISIASKLFICCVTININLVGFKVQCFPLECSGLKVQIKQCKPSCIYRCTTWLKKMCQMLRNKSVVAEKIISYIYCLLSFINQANNIILVMQHYEEELCIKKDIERFKRKGKDSMEEPKRRKIKNN